MGSPQNRSRLPDNIPFSPDISRSVALAETEHAGNHAGHYRCPRGEEVVDEIAVTRPCGKSNRSGFIVTIRGIDGPVKIPDLSWRALQKRETAVSSGCTAEGYAPRNRQSRHFCNASPIRRRCFCQVHLARVTEKIGGEGGKKTAEVRRCCLAPSGKPLQNM